MRVRAEQGDTVDSLCYRHLGSSASVERTLELNPGLAALGTVLPQGHEIELPDSDTGVQQENKLIQLWD